MTDDNDTLITAIRSCERLMTQAKKQNPRLYALMLQHRRALMDLQIEALDSESVQSDS